MHIDANQVLFLFQKRFNDYGMKECKTCGIVPLNLHETMNHSLFVKFTMNDSILTCKCLVTINIIKQYIQITFVPNNQFDIFNLILPCNQDPKIIQETYNLLQTKLSTDTFNVEYKLSFDDLAKLHSEYGNAPSN